MEQPKVDLHFFQQRLDTIRQGLEEAVRREVQRLHKQGLPVYVEKNGGVTLASTLSHSKK
ncbi:MAG: hypothetical protein MI725_02655 [Pirellulales bacterium]|nr:hypothetical protein [Pirellulales bacterium]